MSAEGFTQAPRWVAPGARRPGAAARVDRPLSGPVPELETLAGRWGVTVSDVWLALRLRVLATVTAERELLVGYVPAGAGGAALALRVAVGNSTWRELVRTVAEARKAAAGSGAGAEIVLDARVAQGAGGGLPAGCVLRLGVGGDASGPLLHVGYDRGALDGEFAGRLAGYLRAALGALVADPEGPHHRVGLLSEREVATQVYGLSGRRAERPDATFTDVFARVARRVPDAVAVRHRDRAWTYGELDGRADRLAGALLDAGLGPGETVGVAAERGFDWAVAVLAVWKAGGVYLPACADVPAGRAAAALAASGCGLVLADERNDAWARRIAAGRRVLPVEDGRRGTVGGGGAPADRRVPARPRDAAYLYLTSGSSGRPKVAVCEHAGLLNHLYAKVEDMGLAGEGAGAVVAQTASQGFDISLWQLTAPLLVGGSTRIVDAEVLRDVDAFVTEIVAGGVTVAQVVPSYLEVLLTRLEQEPRTLGALRSLSVTGEPLRQELVRRWFALFPGIPLVNAYGATEVSDDTMHEVLTRPPETGFVPVGRPLPNVHVYVLDEHLALLPLGAPGEIIFSGVCVGRGYLNDEERTRQAFVPDPFRPGARMYRTGDFGRWLPDGRLEFLGRRDEQVRLRGFRIELGEIENRLLAVPGVREAAVVIDRAASAHPRLVAFHTGQPGAAAPGAEELRAELSAEVPAYMVPASFHRLDRLPLTGNGKVDKRLLTRLAGPLEQGGLAVSAPATPAEQRLATLWAEVLHVPLERIGRDDDFFALGGTSLAAVRLQIQLRRALSMSRLLRFPVLRAMAAALENGDGTGGAGGRRQPAAEGLLQPLSTVPGAHHGLVCFPYAGGNAVNFRTLARTLEGDGIAVYGVELPGHDLVLDGEPLAGVREVAERVCAEIRDRVGLPVLLWGHSSGAAHAWETARLLEGAGRAAKLVFVGGLLLAEPGPRRGDAAVRGTDDDGVLARMRAQSSYIELDGYQRERARTVAAAYRHDVLSSERHLDAMRRRGPGGRLRTPLEVVVAEDDPATAGARRRWRDWLQLAERVRCRELPDGGHYFVSTRAGSCAALVRAGCGVPSGAGEVPA
ncbi:amino acid adenylation domain-containing protein [Streptomyces zhaozhouensis]|uniref:Amino acid adenylation domain-containing protein n=1 Tax=Streptomyces zhaozhouensis TaxID=1300267 RepID=A0A286DN81_9ACTN|nr:amino acid adenylation domain-containing protein [Streptomyces zhaozhouensis]SOD60080.1 amino acid adenylation domain-containing protein [Streptomyces zhaozhouensis]